MELLALVLSVITLIGVAVAGISLRSYLPTYLAQKATNLASKEDIAYITSLVEAVKSDYSLALERHKAELVSEGQAIERRRKIYDDICTALRIFTSGHDNSTEAKERS